MFRAEHPACSLPTLHPRTPMLQWAAERTRRPHWEVSLTMEKRRLGRGLDALLGAESASANGGSPVELPTTAIAVNPYQPRKNFDQDELSALAASVRSHGILQPLVVRQAGGSYELVAGERRLRAAREVGLATVPVRIVNFNDQETLEAAL